MQERGEEQIKAIIAGTRRVLLRATDNACPQDMQTDATALSARFRGCCGLAQCVAGYALQDAGLTVKAIATQSLSTYWHGHAALAVETVEAAGGRWFLVDPTFCQFLAPLCEEIPPTPVHHLRQSVEGAVLLEDLLRDGYAALSPVRAMHYLAAFCEGKAPLDAQSAFTFFVNPPQHPYHFRRDVGSDEFSRENLARRGWSIAQSSVTGRW